MRTDLLLEPAAPSRAGRLVSVEREAASGFMAPLHSHAADEAVHVAEGRLTVFAGADRVTLAAGATYVVPAGVAHTFRVASSRARVVFTTFAPSAGRYEDFLRATGPVATGDSGAAEWAGLDDAAAVAAVAAGANVSVHGPPGMLPAGATPAFRAA